MGNVKVKGRCRCVKPTEITRNDKYNTKFCNDCMEVISYEKPGVKKTLVIKSKVKTDKKKEKENTKEAVIKEVTMVTDLFGTHEVEVEVKKPKAQKGALREKFIEPPFTVIDTKRGEWQSRKKAWKKLGIQSEVSREDVVVINNSFDSEKYGRGEMAEVSIFDPALCELMYNWFCEQGGDILDPFAGGSVRGIVAHYLGFKYTGIDIRDEQIVSNIEQGLEILEKDNQPEWICGDSNVVLDDALMENAKYDFLFGCPPYADLEVYSDLKGDISNKPYDEFVEMYTDIIVKSCSKLKNNRYACFVVGDVRDKDGNYYDFIGDTKKAFYKAGLKLYNDAVLLQPLGTAMLRASKIFESGRKLTKVHENILVFKKG